MFDWFPYRLTFGRTDCPARRTRQARPRIGKRLVLIAGSLATLGATGLFSLPAAAGTAGSVTATIPIAILSLTVSPSAVNYGNCRGGNSTATALGFPNGECDTDNAMGRITISNTGAAGHIKVQGSDAVPQGGGTPHWTLCGFGVTPLGQIFAGPLCPFSLSARTAKPGADQFREVVTTRAGCCELRGIDLQNPPQCDFNFSIQGGCGFVPARAFATEFLSMMGPSTSTSPATSFTTTVTWTVVL